MTQQTTGGLGRTPARPETDIYATDDAVEMQVDLPGVRREDIRLNLHQNELLLEAEAADRGGELIGEARIPRRYRRLFTVPEGVRRSEIRARFDNGVLHITLPKTERARPRTIPVEEG